MSTHSIILLGNPDSGKSNFIGRLWLALQSQNFRLLADTPPSDIKYVEELAAHLLQGRFAPRTDKDTATRNFNIDVKSKDGGQIGELIIPDVSGELWKNAVETFEIPSKWLQLISDSSGALLFVRIRSILNTQPLDWVNSKALMSLADPKQQDVILTQVRLLELIRFLEERLAKKNNSNPKVAIVVTAWDLLHQGEQANGPEHYLENEFPIFAGRLLDTQKLNIKVFGCSVVGGDFTVAEFVRQYRGDMENAGYIVRKEKGTWQNIPDITLPIHWLLS
jgi:hypothetical protein